VRALQERYGLMRGTQQCTSCRRWVAYPQTFKVEWSHKQSHGWRAICEKCLHYRAQFEDVRWVVPNLLDTALSYLRKAWSIFPLFSPLASSRCLAHRQCGNPGKVPLLSWKQYQTGLPTTDDVYRWWSAWPESGIGLATGYRSGVVVLDLDGADALRDAG